ncbi:hypothetical protein ERJ75_000049500 [Trypanosoma vivax]|uniref:Uncharacterized protein n=1 Tax=Trypanosoma vivax (strain Y486) TaxID=1055687 RepID=G0U764_TRYVY|nr:hypothetical protein TRVL_01430 [Trypanosoma vivax]KAH8620655.1 hypothetical protein ERJ75_000049500 [Trypanosoma vivax]CCC51721.1 conserved hypothetical protein [Trypanosoma vivax Y486]
MQLCYSCRHAFPQSSLSSCVFSEIISHRFDNINNIITEMKLETPEQQHQALKLQEALRELCSAIHQEFGALKEQKTGAEGSHGRESRDRAALRPTSRPGAADTISPTPVQATPRISSRLSHGNVVPRATFNGTVPHYKLRKMNSALELVSASIYCVLESVAIRTRSAVALLWLPPPGAVSAELVAPFVVGRDLSKIRNSAPHRVSETSIPCAVSEAGIALNLKPRQGKVEAKLSENAPLVELIELSNAAQLLVPIFTRYGEIRRSVLGVLHLLGSPVFPCPFSPRNEEMAVQTAATLSIILSSYHETMGGEWANRIYDPSLLVSSSAYRGSLDMRSTQKIVDDFAPPPTLIYRGVHCRRPDDDIREEIKVLRHAMTRRPVRFKPLSSIKDLHRFALSMEENWVSMLKTTTEMEAKISKLEENAIQAELEKRQRCPSSTFGQTTNVNSENTIGGFSRSPTPSVFMLPQMNDGKTVLRPEYINSIETAALHRLRKLGVDTAPFEAAKESE